jgi:ketosteroid isomerase-like protein
MLVAIAAAPATFAGSQSPAIDEAELRRLEAVWNDAHLRADAKALDALWADELIVTLPGMRVLSKAESLSVLQSGRMKFVKYDTSELRVQLYGDSAVVTGRLQRSRDMIGRTLTDDWRFTKVYVRRSGAWRVVAWHGSATT